MPTAARRHLEVPARSVRDGACPTRELLDRVGDKWSVLLLLVLAESDALRYSALRRALPELSPKVLTQTLRGLSRDGLVARSVVAVSPPHVEYELTPLGRSLVGALGALTEWAEQHVEQMREARRTDSDAQTPWLEPREAARAEPRVFS